jgi:hypothetical protein
LKPNFMKGDYAGRYDLDDSYSVLYIEKSIS